LISREESGGAAKKKARWADGRAGGREKERSEGGDG